MGTPTGRTPCRRHRPLRHVALALASLSAVLAGAGLAGCGSSGPNGSSGTTGAPSSPSSTPSPSAGPTGAPPIVPVAGAYLGAWLHPQPPTQSKGSSFAVEQSDLPKVTTATGHPLGTLHIYTPWARPAPVSSLRAVAAAGSIPLVDWGCGPDAGQVGTGADDGVISTYASDLRAYGGPVLLRWCWEMNLVGKHPQLGGPAGFTSAWDHIRALFRRAGATNVAFVWCPALTGVDPQPYFPGASEVDWIGVDGYDRNGTQTFGSLFGDFYRTWASQGKPMMVAETGAAGADQVAYIDSIGTDAPTMPGFKAVSYFDAPGPLENWEFTPAGLQAFARLAAQPYFQPH